MPQGPLNEVQNITSSGGQKKPSKDINAGESPSVSMQGGQLSSPLELIHQFPSFLEAVQVLHGVQEKSKSFGEGLQRTNNFCPSDEVSSTHRDETIGISPGDSRRNEVTSAASDPGSRCDILPDAADLRIAGNNMNPQTVQYAGISRENVHDGRNSQQNSSGSSEQDLVSRESLLSCGRTSGEITQNAGTVRNSEIGLGVSQSSPQLPVLRQNLCPIVVAPSGTDEDLANTCTRHVSSDANLAHEQPTERAEAQLLDANIPPTPSALGTPIIITPGNSEVDVSFAGSAIGVEECSNEECMITFARVKSPVKETKPDVNALIAYVKDTASIAMETMNGQIATSVPPINPSPVCSTIDHNPAIHSALISSDGTRSVTTTGPSHSNFVRPTVAQIPAQNSFVRADVPQTPARSNFGRPDVPQTPAHNNFVRSNVAETPRGVSGVQPRNQYVQYNPMLPQGTSQGSPVPNTRPPIQQSSVNNYVLGNTSGQTALVGTGAVRGVHPSFLPHHSYLFDNYNQYRSGPNWHQFPGSTPAMLPNVQPVQQQGSCSPHSGVSNPGVTMSIGGIQPQNPSSVQQPAMQSNNNIHSPRFPPQYSHSPQFNSRVDNRSTVPSLNSRPQQVPHGITHSVSSNVPTQVNLSHQQPVYPTNNTIQVGINVGTYQNPSMGNYQQGAMSGIPPRPGFGLQVPSNASNPQFAAVRANNLYSGTNTHNPRHPDVQAYGPNPGVVSPNTFQTVCNGQGQPVLPPAGLSNTGQRMMRLPHRTAQDTGRPRQQFLGTYPQASPSICHVSPSPVCATTLPSFTPNQPISSVNGNCSTASNLDTHQPQNTVRPVYDSSPFSISQLTTRLSQPELQNREPEVYTFPNRTSHTVDKYASSQSGNPANRPDNFVSGCLVSQKIPWHILVDICHLNSTENKMEDVAILATCLGSACSPKMQGQDLCEPNMWAATVRATDELKDNVTSILQKIARYAVTENFLTDTQKFLQEGNLTSQWRGFCEPPYFINVAFMKCPILTRAEMTDRTSNKGNKVGASNCSSTVPSPVAGNNNNEKISHNVTSTVIAGDSVQNVPVQESGEPPQADAFQDLLTQMLEVKDKGQITVSQKEDMAKKLSLYLEEIDKTRQSRTAERNGGTENRPHVGDGVGVPISSVSLTNTVVVPPQASQTSVLSSEAALMRQIFESPVRKNSTDPPFILRKTPLSPPAVNRVTQEKLASSGSNHPSDHISYLNKVQSPTVSSKSCDSNSQDSTLIALTTGLSNNNAQITSSSGLESSKDAFPEDVTKLPAGVEQPEYVTMPDLLDGLDELRSPRLNVNMDKSPKLVLNSRSKMLYLLVKKRPQPIVVLERLDQKGIQRKVAELRKRKSLKRRRLEIKGEYSSQSDWNWNSDSDREYFHVWNKRKTMKKAEINLARLLNSDSDDSASPRKRRRVRLNSYENDTDYKPPMYSTTSKTSSSEDESYSSDISDDGDDKDKCEGSDEEEVVKSWKSRKRFKAFSDSDSTVEPVEPTVVKAKKPAKVLPKCSSKEFKTCHESTKHKSVKGSKQGGLLVTKSKPFVPDLRESKPERSENKKVKLGKKKEDSKAKRQVDHQKEDSRSKHKVDRRKEDSKAKHKVDHGKEDLKARHKVDHGKEDSKARHKVDHGKADSKTRHKVDHGKEDSKARHKVDHGKEDSKARHKVDHGKEDSKARHKVDHGKEDSKARHKVDHGIEYSNARHKVDHEKEDSKPKHKSGTNKPTQPKGTVKDLRERYLVDNNESGLKELEAKLDALSNVPANLSSEMFEQPKEESDASLPQESPNTQVSLDNVDSEELWAELETRDGLKFCECGLIFQDQPLYYLHFSTHTTNAYLTCAMCRQTLKDKHSFLTHFFDGHDAGS